MRPGVGEFRDSLERILDAATAHAAVLDRPHPDGGEPLPWVAQQIRDDVARWHELLATARAIAAELAEELPEPLSLTQDRIAGREERDWSAVEMLEPPDPGRT